MRVDRAALDALLVCRMNRATILCVFALVACEQSPSAPTTKAAEPAAPMGEKAEVVEPVVEDTSPPSFAALVNHAPWVTGARVDAAGLGNDVAIYLVDRAGGEYEQGGGESQSTDLSLVLVGGDKVLRVALSDFGIAAFDGLRPFGELGAVKPPSKPRKYDVDKDGFDRAPRFRSKSNVPLSYGTHTYPFEDDLAWVVTRETDTLVVWFAEAVWEEGASEAWDKRVVISLPSGATVTTPTAVTTIDEPTGPVAVQVVEMVGREVSGSFPVEIELRVGDRAGRVGMCNVAASSEPLTPGERSWTMHTPPMVAGAVAAKVPELAPFTPTGVLLAHRICNESAEYTTRFGVERAGEEIVVWTRTDKTGEPPEPCSARVRAALPAASKIAVR
jgi:hypothetical protein